MKKVWKTVLVLALAALCLTAVAAAADAPSGICDVTVESGFTGSVTWKAQKADGTQVSSPTTSGDKQVYADAVKLELTYTGADATAQYLVLVLNDGSEVPTETNVAYVDQTGNTASAVFTIYPNSLTTGKTYDIYLSSNSTTDSSIGAKTKVASFGYYAAYTLGDVNEDGSITPDDALCALQIYANTPGQTWTENQRLAADVDKTGSVSPDDALKILQRYANLIPEF